MEEIISLALRALRRPRTGLGGVLAAIQSRVDATVTAVYLAPPGPGPVELIASSGPGASALGPPGPLDGAPCRAIRALAALPPGWDPPPGGAPPPWSDAVSLGHIPTQLPSGGASLLLAAAATPGDLRSLQEASAAAGLLAALFAMTRETDQLRRELHEVHQSRSLLAAGIQHDLRTPLTSILGSARTLKLQGEMLGERERAELLDIVASQAERLTQMLSDAIVPETVGPDAPLRLAEWAMEEICTRVAAAAQVGRGGAVEVEAQPGAIVTDAGRVERALLNLVDNGLKYAPEGTAVHLSGVRRDDGYLFSVADPGPGVAEAVVPTLFTAYATDPGRAGGVGLGLHSVAALASDLGGRVAYARNEGWTRFTLWIPDLRARENDHVSVAAEARR